MTSIPATPGEDLHAHPDQSAGYFSHCSAHSLSGQHVANQRAREIARVIIIIFGVLSLLGYLVNF
jgi:hypothetical protein